MQPACRTFRDELHDPSDRPGPCAEHAAGCSECAAYARRAARAARALGALHRRPAPLALDGSVVAALEAGARQERATRALASLARLPAPELLEPTGAPPGEPGRERPAAERLMASSRLSAPPVLERLVAEELLDPAAARARRYVASLARLSAPEELALRLARAPQAEPQRRPRAWSRRALAAAAGLAFLLWLGPWRASEEPRHRLRLEAARPADLAALDGYAQSLIGGLSGGLGAVGEGGGGGR